MPAVRFRDRREEAALLGEDLQPILVRPVRRGGVAEILQLPGRRGVDGEQGAVRHRQRIAEVSGLLRHLRVVAGRRHGGERHVLGVDRWRAGETHERAAGGGAELGRIGGEEVAGNARILAQLQKAAVAADVELVRVQARVDVVRQVRIGGEAAVGVGAAELVPADVVQRLLRGPVLVQLPREEVVERMERERRRVCGIVLRARLREDLGTGKRRGGRRIGGLARPGEGLIRGDDVGRVALLVALQVIPFGEDHASEGVDRGREAAARRVLEQLEIARRFIERVDAGDGKR
jgi:hypothetical protein